MQVPFVTPPRDGTQQRRWLAIWLSIATAVVCCAGSLFGLGGLVVLGSAAVVEEARTAVVRYLTALRDRDFEQAYGELCEAQQQRTSPGLLAAQPRLRSFDVGDPVVGDEVHVPATLRFINGNTARVTYRLEQDSRTGDFEVCGSDR